MFYDTYKDIIYNLSTLSNLIADYLDILDQMRNYTQIIRTSNITNFRSGSNYTDFSWIIVDKYIQIIYTDDQISILEYITNNLESILTNEQMFLLVIEGDLKKKSTAGFYNLTYSKIYATPGKSYSIILVLIKN